MKCKTCTAPLMKLFTSWPFIIIFPCFITQTWAAGLYGNQPPQKHKKKSYYYWFLFQCKLMAQLPVPHLQSRASIFHECLFMSLVQTTETNDFRFPSACFPPVPVNRKHFFTHSFCFEGVTVIFAPKPNAPSVFSAGRNHLTLITWPAGSEAKGFTGLVIYTHLHLNCQLKTWKWCFFISCWLLKSFKWKLFMQAAQICRDR